MFSNDRLNEGTEQDGTPYFQIDRSNGLLEVSARGRWLTVSALDDNSRNSSVKVHIDDFMVLVLWLEVQREQEKIDKAV